MMLAVTFLVTTAFVFTFRTLVKRLPLLFYLLAAAMALAFAVSDSALLPPAVVAAFVIPMGRCYIAFSLFAIVMFTGVLGEGSRMRGCLAPIRAELSIAAAILVCAHVVRYASAYLVRLFDGAAAVATNLYLAFAIAAVVSVLLGVLTVTSFRVVKSRMPARAWKAVQRLAYPFFALVCMHAIVALAPSALGGSTASAVAVAQYFGVLALYGVLRVRRERVDKARRRESVGGIADAQASCAV